MTQTQQTFVDKFFKDSEGKVVLVQSPNWSIIGWFSSKLIGYIHLPTQYHNGFVFLETAFLFAWAGSELFTGANYFRRALGLLVLIFIVLPRFN